MAISLIDIRSGITSITRSIVRQEYGHYNLTFVSGPPSCGKNTRMEIVESACGRENIKTHDIGTIISEEIRDDTDLGKIFSRSSQIQNEGGLQQDEPIIFALLARIKTAYAFGTKRHLVCGFPRSPYQSWFLLKSGLCFNLKVINTTRERCEELLKMRKASSLRLDDNHFSDRWKTFTEKTVPAIQLVRDRNLACIRGGQEQSDILKDCLDIIQALGLDSPEQEEAIKNLTVKYGHPARQAILKIMDADNTSSASVRSAEVGIQPILSPMTAMA